MKFKLHRNFGALNSKPVFDAVEKGLIRQGHTVVDQDQDIDVIWSVLWHGRMSSNKQIYNSNQAKGKRTLIIEVGNLFRNKTWRLSLDHIDNTGIYGNKKQLDRDRPKKLGMVVGQQKSHRGKSILITTQHNKSLQWQGMPTLAEWANCQINQLRKYTDRPIVVRPHPRCTLDGPVHGASIDLPKHISGSYDDFDINYDYHCVINHNSGPTVQAALNGTPIICHSTSLAFPVSDKIENIENIQLENRDEWVIELSHTEWTVEEIAVGTPIVRILDEFH
jgi:hypothetical protein